MKVAIVAITRKGKRTALKVKKSLPESRLYMPAKLNCKLGELTGKLFAEFEGIVFCMALGIVIRVISPYIKDKHIDPAIVVVDDEGRFVISALSGHEGGANRLAIRVAGILNAEPVITTASELNKNIIIGIGCRRGIKKEEVLKAIRYALNEARYSIDKVRCVATIELKQNESGLREACAEAGIPMKIVSSEAIKNFNGQYQRSSFVKEKIGVEGVAEPCALIAAKKPELILPKKKVGRVTVAVVKGC